MASKSTQRAVAALTGLISGAAKGAEKIDKEKAELQKEILKDRETTFNTYLKDYQRRITEEDKIVKDHESNINRLTAEYMSLGLTQEDANAAAFGNYKKNPNKQFVDTEVSTIQKLRDEGVATTPYILQSLNISAADPSKPSIDAKQLARQLTPETKFTMPYFGVREDTVSGLDRFLGIAKEGQEASRLREQRSSFESQMNRMLAARPKRGPDVELSRTVGGRLPPVQKVLSIPMQLERLELQKKNASTPAELEAIDNLIDETMQRRELLRDKGSEGQPPTENTFANALRGVKFQDVVYNDKTLLEVYPSVDNTIQNQQMMVKTYAYRQFASAKLQKRGAEYENKLMQNMMAGLNAGPYGSLLGRDFFNNLEQDYAIRGGVYTLDEYKNKLQKATSSTDEKQRNNAEKVLSGKIDIERIMRAFYIPRENEAEDTYSDNQVLNFITKLNQPM